MMTERREIAVCGTVQGVGFRPFVYGLATQLSLSGFVRNQPGRVQIEVEGDAETLDQITAQLVNRLPALARIDALSWTPRALVGDIAFVIESSGCDGAGPIVIAPDTATCADCIAELFDPHDRRYRYPFTNCTKCGPRLSIVTGAPHDRANDDGGISDVFRLQGRVRKSRRSAVSRSTNCISGLRTEIADAGWRGAAP